MEKNKDSKKIMENTKQLDAMGEIKIDQERLDKVQKDLEDMRLEISTKEYLVKMDIDTLEFLENFMNFKVSWKGKEALGVSEILKKINEIKKDGIKNNSVYMTNLQIEATHYFLTKYEGSGSTEIYDLINLLKSIENSLQLVGSDNKRVKDLEKELVAAQQGIETC
jgi:hypothetical protein